MSRPRFRPDLKSEPWLPLAEAIRARGQIVTPFRLGQEAGRCNLSPPCPYTLPRSIDGYRKGLAWGRRGTSHVR